VIAACYRRGQGGGIMTRSREDADARDRAGLRFVAVGSDSLFLAQAARAAAGT
jgi:2-keto-3-deoxy-L-rhamnonate aldolase RhmA